MSKITKELARPFHQLAQICHQFVYQHILGWSKGWYLYKHCPQKYPKYYLTTLFDTLLDALPETDKKTLRFTPFAENAVQFMQQHCGGISVIESDWNQKRTQSTISAGETIHVSFSSDIAYYPHLAVLITSILHNNANEHFAFYVMTDKEDAEAQKPIIALSERYKNFTLRFIVMDNSRFEHLPIAAHWSLQTFYRFLLPELFPELNKIIYLDADMVCNGSIQELWTTDIGGNYAGGCIDPVTTPECSKFISSEWTNRKQLIGQSDEHLYVNAGVLVLNLKKIRNDNKVPELFAFIENHRDLPGIGDQDAINYVFRGKMHRFDGKYNFQWTDSILLLLHKCRHESGGTMPKPAIVHFTCNYKPWNEHCRHNILSFLYHQYAQMNDAAALIKARIEDTGANLLPTRSELIASYFPKHSTGMEVGIFRGEFASFLLDTLQPKHLYLVDPFEPAPMYSGDKDGLNVVTVPNLRQYYADNLVPLFGSLPNVSLLSDYSFNVLQQIPDGSLDWIYIDGDHSYEGCRKDLALAKQKVKSGGIIAGHDYCPQFGVMRAVDEFCQQHSYSIEVLTQDGCPSWLIRNGADTKPQTFSERVENPLVSVVIPVYNVEKYLRECLDSVVNQTLRELQIICVNDGSTDGSLAILKEYAAKDSRIEIIDKENGGEGKARNTALSHVIGKYVLFVDSDDYIKSAACEKLVAIAEETAAPLVMFDLINLEYWFEISAAAIARRILVTPEEKKLVSKQCGTAGKLWLTSLFVKNSICFGNEAVGPDVIVFWKGITKADKVAVLPEKLYYYRQVQTSAINSKSVKRLSIVDAWKNADEYLRESGYYTDYRNVFIQHKLSGLSGYNLSKIPDEQHDAYLRKLLSSLTEDDMAYIRSDECSSDMKRFYLRHFGTVHEKRSLVFQERVEDIKSIVKLPERLLRNYVIKPMKRKFAA